MSGTTGGDQALTATPARRVARRILGPTLPYLLHLRPLEWPVVAVHTVIGWLLAGGLRPIDRTGVLGVAVWVVALNGGALALNSTFEQPNDDAAYLHLPPPVPSALGWFAAALILTGGVLTWSMPTSYRVAYVVCAVIAVLYSVPLVRLKAVNGADWMIKVVGFGVATPFAGWALSGRPFTGPITLVVWAFCPLFAALYPLIHLHRMDEDLTRGNRTLVLRLGIRCSLGVALLAMGLSFGLLFGAAWQAGWRGGPEWPRWAALTAALMAWLVVLGPWFRDGRRWSSAEHRRGMYHALAAWTLTDVAVFLGWVI